MYELRTSPGTSRASIGHHSPPLTPRFAFFSEMPSERVRARQGATRCRSWPGLPRSHPLGGHTGRREPALPPAHALRALVAPPPPLPKQLRRGGGKVESKSRSRAIWALKIASAAVRDVYFELEQRTRSPERFFLTPSTMGARLHIRRRRGAPDGRRSKSFERPQRRLVLVQSHHEGGPWHYGVPWLRGGRLP